MLQPSVGPAELFRAAKSTPKASLSEQLPAAALLQPWLTLSPTPVTSPASSTTAVPSWRRRLSQVLLLCSAGHMSLRDRASNVAAWAEPDSFLAA